MNRSNRLWGILLLGAIVLGGWTAYTGTKRNSSDASAGVETMLVLADRLYASSYDVVLQHSGTYRTAESDDSFAQLGNRLAEAFELPASKPTRDANGHRLYKSSSQRQSEAAGRLDIGLSGWADGATNMTLRWEAPQGAEKDTVLAWAKDAVHRLDQVGARANWMVTVNGYIGLLSDDAVKALRAQIGDVYKARVVESYADSGSEIVSYTSSLLPSGVRAGGGNVNLQSALHRDSVYRTYRLTVATPLISSGL